MPQRSDHKQAGRAHRPRPAIYVDTDAALRQMVEELASEAIIGLDTESNPLFAYRERLCLLQFSSRDSDFIVDPLVELDLDLLAPVLADAQVLKVLHDAEFDLLMLKRTHPFEIRPIFDTKVAACAVGRAQVGLAALLLEFFDVQLDKRHQRSDWGRRPLTREQVEYAATDTRHLIDLAGRLRSELRQRPVQRWLEVAAECRRLEGLVPEIKTFCADEFARIKGADALSPVQRRALRELFVWRHHRADDLDRPAFKVVSSEILLEVAAARPQSDAELRESKILSAKMRERWGGELLAVVRQAATRPGIERTRPPPDEIARLNEAQYARYESLRRWRKDTAEAQGTDASLLLPRGLMLALARCEPVPQDGKALAGLLEPWRVAAQGAGILAALQQVKAARRRR